MTDSLAAELVEASCRVLDAELPQPTGLDPEPHIQRWRAIRPHLEALGWFDLLADPATGGLGLSPALAARLVRLAGSYLVPGPVMETVLTVPWLLTQPGMGPGLLGDRRATVAMVDPCRDLPSVTGPSPIQLRNGRLNGAVRCVLGAGTADLFLVTAVGDTERLILVPSAHAGVQVEPLRGADACQSVSRVEFDCMVGNDQLVGAPDDQLPMKLRAWARLGSAAYLAGISERVLAFGVAHALQREQFGRPIGSFQAIQHLLAKVAVIRESLANLIDFTTEQLPVVETAEAVLIAASAKAQASADAVVACETTLQVLGGIGFTVEHPLHHYFKRALSLAAHHGSAAELHLLVGRSVLGQTHSELSRRHGAVSVP